MSRWKNKKVGELFDVQLGKMLSKKAKQGELFPYLANFNVRWGSFDLSRMNAMNFSNREMAKYQLKKNDILMCEGGEIGRCAVWKEDDSQIFFQKALHRLRARNQHEINPYFFYAYMQHICSNNSLVKLVGETSIAHLTREKLIELKFPIPEKTHQDQIVKILETWDTAIEKTDALIAAKERQFGWLRSELINKCQGEKFSLQALEEKGLIEMGRGNIISKKDILANPGDNPIYSSSVKNNGLFGCYGNFMFDEELITWSIDGGGNFFLRKKHKFSVTNVCGFMKVARKAINCGFLAAQLQERQSKLKFDYQFKAHPSVIRKIYNVVIPSIKEQKNIAEILDTAQQEITILKNLANQYRTQKRGLMQKLLSGEWQLNPKEENHEKR